MSILFEPIRIGNLEIRNRFIRSATYFGLSDIDGFIGQPGVDVIRQLAENEVGLIITGFAYVLKNGQAAPDMNGIQSDDHIPGYKKMTEAVHEAGGHVVMQIMHGGVNAYTVSIWGGDYVAVSLTEHMPRLGKAPREMDEGDIEKMIEAFGQAGRRVRDAGFDGVQIHGAHGYLVSQFLSPATNRREDRWGGSLENRMRFVKEVVRAIKAQVGEDFPVMIKLGCKDYLSDGSGLTIDEGAVVAKALEEEGICLIEISQGNRTNKKLLIGKNPPEKEARFLEETRVIRKHTAGRLCFVGGLRSLPVMENLVESGTVDCISLCRPLIREPDLIKRWKEGYTGPSECISCDGCFHPDSKGGNDIYCRVLEQTGREKG